MIYSVVTMMIKPGQMEAFLAECRKIRPLVLAEDGCRMYDYTREINSGSDRQEPIDPNRVTLFEKWESLEALDTHSAAPHMTDGGSIVNTSSCAGIMGVPTYAPYVISKAAVIGLTKTAALELGPRMIRVNAILILPKIRLPVKKEKTILTA